MLPLLSAGGDSVRGMSQQPAARIDPPLVADEAAMLTAWLDYQRATLAIKVHGVPAERLAERAVPPSGLSLLGLVRHMSEVERSWFRRVMADEQAPPLYYSDANPDGDFDDVDTADPAADLQAWHREVGVARALCTGLSLETMSAARRHGEHFSLRWITVHMIEEYARHNGHADLLRERIDGQTGE